MWIKLLQRESINDLLKPQFVNGAWRKPDISGRQKAQLKMYFEKAGVPWIYEKERPEVHSNSVYNRKPKGMQTYWNNYETRISTIRANLAM